MPQKPAANERIRIIVPASVVKTECVSAPSNPPSPPLFFSSKRSGSGGPLPLRELPPTGLKPQLPAAGTPGFLAGHSAEASLLCSLLVTLAANDWLQEWKQRPWHVPRK